MVELVSEVRVALAQLPKAADGPDAVMLRERRPSMLAEFAAWPGTEKAVASALKKFCGLRPATTASRALQSGRATILTLTPRRWWLLSDDPGLSLAALALAGDTGTSVDLSHARVGLRLAGPGVRGLLARGMAVDLHPSTFPIDAVAQSGFAEVPAVLHRASDEAYDLFLPRTFARHTLEWLTESWPALSASGE